MQCFLLNTILLRIKSFSGKCNSFVREYKCSAGKGTFSRVNAIVLRKNPKAYIKKYIFFLTIYIFPNPGQQKQS